MFKIVLIMAFGILTGWLLRRRKLHLLGKIISLLIWTLLFLLGVEVGGDDRIVKGIASLGLEAVVITLGGLTGCSLFAFLLWRLTLMVRRKRQTSGKEVEQYER